MADVTEHLVNTPEELVECSAYLAGCPQIGLDTEFVGEESYHPHLCLIQVATDERLFLIDPLSVGPLDAFWPLIVDSQRVTVVHAGREEVRLCHRSSGHMPGNVFDTQIAAGLIGLTYPLGHATLVSQLLNVQLAKGETRTEWRRPSADRPAGAYAFDDVRYLLPLWQAMSRELEALGRAAWAQEEFGRLTANAAPEEEVIAEKWRKLRGLGSLDRRRLALARSLHHWREQLADKLNRPARVVLRDDLVVEIARRNPSKDADLHPVRGLARRDVPAIFQALEAAGAAAGTMARGRRARAGPAATRLAGQPADCRAWQLLRQQPAGWQPGRQQSGHQAPGARTHAGTGAARTFSADAGLAARTRAPRAGRRAGWSTGGAHRGFARKHPS